MKDKDIQLFWNIFWEGCVSILWKRPKIQYLNSLENSKIA